MNTLHLVIGMVCVHLYAHNNKVSDMSACKLINVWLLLVYTYMYMYTIGPVLIARI